jgi:hypothetical protein
MTTLRTDEWPYSLAGWVAVAALATAAFWIGSGPSSALIVGVWMLLLVGGVHLGRRRVDALRIAGGAGDERNRQLYSRVNAFTGSVLWAVITAWWLTGVFRGEQDSKLMLLVCIHAVSYFGSAAYYSFKG